MISTLDSSSLRCPPLPIWGMMMCRLYRLTCSGVRLTADWVILFPSLANILEHAPGASGRSIPTEAPGQKKSLRLHCP